MVSIYLQLLTKFVESMKILLKHINLFSLVRSTQLFGCNYWCFTSIHGKLLSTVSIVTRSISLSGIANLSLGNQFRTNKVRFIEFLVFCSSEIFLIYQHQSSLQINSFSSWVCSSLVNKLTFGPWSTHILGKGSKDSLYRSIVH